MMPRVAGVSGKQHDQDVGRVEERHQAAVAVEGRDALDRLLGPAPAIDAEAERLAAPAPRRGRDCRAP